MTTSEQRELELIAQLHAVLYGSEWARNESPSAVWAEMLAYIEQLHFRFAASEAEKRRLIEAVRYVSDAVIDHSYASVQLERACDEAEAQ